MTGSQVVDGPEREARPLWVIPTVILVTANVARLVTPLSWMGFELQMVAQAVITCSIVAVSALGLVLRRPERKLTWVLISASLACLAVGDVSVVVIELLLDAAWTDARSDVVSSMYWLPYPILAAALIAAAHRRSPGWHWPALIDAAILTTVLALVWWIYVVNPGTGLPGWDQLAFPVPDIVIFTAMARLMFTAGTRSTAYLQVMAAGFLLLLGDLLNGLSLTAGVDLDTWTPWDDMPFAAAVALLGGASLHPGMAGIDGPASTPAPPISYRRMVALGTATLVPPAVLLIEHGRGRHDGIPVIAAACGAIFLLVISQTYGLIRREREVAITDALTGVHSRLYWDQQLRALGSRRRSRPTLGVVMVDVDHFKQVNDSLGHPAGDEVLRQLANRLRGACRQEDIVARYGGEEFVALLPGASPQEALVVGERIRRTVAAEPIVVGEDVQLEVTVSVGVACLNHHASNVEELLNRADAALYRAKAAGRNRVDLATGTPAVGAVAGVGAGV